MSFSSDYLELRKKRKKQDNVSADSNSFESEYFELRNNRNADIAPVLSKPNSDDVVFGINTRLAASELARQQSAEGEDKWFKKSSAFDDGYDFGDITKTVLATGGDAVINVAKGVNASVEGIADLILHGVSGVSKLAGNDELAEKSKKLAEFNYTEYGLGGLEHDFLDENSIIGGKGDAIPNALGQILTIIGTGNAAGAAGLTSKGVSAVTTSAMGLSSMGSGINEAYQGGATDGEAWAYGAMKGAVDAGSELIFGGLGKGVNALGVSRGLTSIDDVFAKKLSSKISNRFFSNLAEYGVKATAEGVEELLAGFGTIAAKKWTYMSEVDREQIIKDENLLDQFIVGVISSGIAQGGDLISSTSSGRDFITDFSKNEESVLKAEYESRIKEAEADGTKLTNKQKNEIYKQVESDLKKGYISTDTIESVLGGDSYKAYQDTIKSEEAAIEELKGLYEGDELKANIDNIINNSKRGELKTKLSEEVQKSLIQQKGKRTIADTYLVESYNENARRGQAYNADISQYDETYRATVQKAIDSGILNNTRRTHEFVDMIAKISADKGVSFDFTNNEKLKGTSFAVDGKTVNGFVDENGTITLNAQSAKYLNTVVGHEITHVLEGTDLYNVLQDTLVEYASSKKASDSKFENEYKERLYNARNLYQTVKGYEGADGHNKIKNEVVADMVGDYLFTDPDFVTHLSTKNRNVFQKLYDEIKYLCKIATAGSKEARELEKVKRAFENAYRADGKTDSKAKAETKYSLSTDSDGRELSAEQREYFKDSKVVDENGSLKVMYHGSQDAGFHVFDPSMSDDDTSLFFVDRNDVAASYSGTSETYEAQTIRTAEDMNNFLAKIGYDSYKAVEKDGKFELLENNEHVAYSDTAQGLYDEFCWYEGVGEGDVNYKVYLNLKNPLEVDAGGRNWNNISREYSQEIADRYASLTAEEKAALTNLAEWGEYSIFRDEMLEARATAEQGGSGVFDEAYTKKLASAYEKLGGANANLYDAFSIAQENFSEESLKEFAVKQMNTRDYAKKAKAEGYDGVIFKNLVDVGGYSNGSEGASTVAIAFESNQIKSVANEKPTGNADIRYSLSADSNGRKLTKEQSAYFKDSKVVDESGNLKVMYHGTPNGDFTVFKDGTYFTENKAYADIYQNPNASMLRPGKGVTSPKTFEVYLDIKKPFDISDKEARSIYINEYIKGGNAVGINPYLSDAEYNKIDSIDWTEGEDLREFLIDNGYDYDGLVLDEGAVGGYGDDVKSRGKSYVVFSPEQVKNADNKAPTKNPDIRYSLTEYTDDEKKAHNKAVVDYFGKTYKWAETGYVLLDGTKLDLSGKHEGAPGGYRTVDHRDIVNALGDDYGDDSYSGALVQFMSEGNIRISPESNGINLSVKPTKAQEQALSDFISKYRGEILLDIDDSNGYTVVSVEYPKGTYYTKILNDIREWFDNGKKPEVSGFAGFRSLSPKGEKPKRYGRYNVSSKDIMLENAPTQEEFAPVKEVVANNATTTTERVEDFIPTSEEDAYNVPNLAAEIEEAYAKQAELENRIEEAWAKKDQNAADKLVEEYVALLEKTQKLEAQEKAVSSDIINSYDDTDVPAEMEAPYYGEEADTTPLNKKSVNAIAETVQSILSFDKKEMPKMQELIRRYSEGEISRDELFNEIKTDFGTFEQVAFEDDTLNKIKQHLKRQRIKQTSTIKAEMAYKNDGKYGDFRKRNFGKLMLTKNGMHVDTLYQELNSLFGNYFPAEITHEAEQLSRILEVMEMDSIVYEPYDIDTETLQEATNAIINGVNEFRQSELESFVESESKAAMSDLLRSEAEHTPIAEADIAPVAEKYEAIKPKGKEAQSTKNRMARADKVKTEEQQTAKILDTEPETANKKGRGWSKFVQNFVDKFAPFEKLALKTGNRELTAKANYMLSSESRAQWLIGKGADGVKSLNEIRKEVESTGRTKQFYDYLYHKHNVDRMSLETRYKDVNNKAVFGDSVTSEQSQEIVKQYENADPKFKEYAQDVYDYMNYLRKQMVDNGVISQETADLWAEMYPHYVPIRRVGDSGLNVNVPLDTGRTGINAPVKRATGGSRDILPLFDTMAMRTEQTYRAIARNSFGLELKNTLGSTVESNVASLDEMIDSIEQQDGLLQKGENGRKPTFTVFENGEKVTFEITEEMYDALKPMSEGMAYTNKALNTVSNIRKGMITEYNPVFMMTNAIKDVQDLLVNSQHPFKTYKNLPKAIKELSTKGRWYAEYMQNGGEQNTYFDRQTNTFKAEDNGFIKAVGMPLRAISAANNFIERAPRLAEYIASRESGASVETAMLDAARVTTNFAAGGDVTKLLNRNGATFLNASVQGFNQQVRNVREAKANGLKGWLGLAAKFAIAGLPAMLLNGLMWEDDEEYEELSDYVKQNYYVVAKLGDGQFVRIPKGRTVAVIQDAFEQVGNMLTGNDEADFNSFFELFLNNLAPNNPIDNNIISPIIQVANNETWYGEDLVPSRLQDLPEAEQYDESTDMLSRWLGEKLNYSPYKINYLLDQYSGGVGDVLLPMITPEAESGDNSLLGNMMAPVKDKFTTDSVMNNQNVSDFYNTVDELTANAKSSKATDEDILKYKYMNSVNAELSELYKQKREIQNSDLSDSEKYEAVREVQKQIDELAKDSLNTYNNVYISDGYAEVGDRHFRLNDKGEWTKLTDDQLDKQEDVTGYLGIDPSTYWQNKSEYDFAYEYPEKYAVAKAIGGYDAYKTYSSELYDIKADKDEDGKSINGSRKEKVITYIDNMEADYGEKIILFKSEYPADDTYNYDIIDYLNSREDISYEEMVTILKELGFTIGKDGETITW